jgi:TolB protein
MTSSVSAVDGAAPDGDGRPQQPSPRPPVIVALVVSLVVLAGLVAIALLVLAGSPRVGSPSGGRIVIVDAAGQLRTMDASGGSEHTFALSGTTAQFPAWSPDGARLAAVGLKDDEAGLYVLDDGESGDSAQTVPEALYTSAQEPPFYLYWSPDGRQVTFLTSEADGLALRAVPADGSTSGGIVRRGAPMYWTWTADDRMLVHAGGDGPDAYVGEVSLDGQETRRAAVVPGPFQAPAVSTDGQRRAYVVSTAEPELDTRSTVILIEDGRDGSVRRVAVRGRTALGWGPGESRLAFIAPRERQVLPVGPLDVLETSSTQPRTLLDDDVVAFFWSPNGSTIAALALTDDRPPQVASRVPLAPGSKVRPAAGPGGALQLVVLAADDGSILLDRSVLLSETFIRQLLPFFDQYALSHHLWSPDGSALVLPLVADDGRAQITIIPLDGSQPRVIADGEIAFWAPDPGAAR